MKPGTGEWSPAVAEDLARREGLRLESAHWAAIAAVRELIARSGAMPPLFVIARACGMTPARINQLFPGETLERLARLAGVSDIEKERI